MFYGNDHDSEPDRCQQRADDTVRLTNVNDWAGNRRGSLPTRHECELPKWRHQRRSFCQRGRPLQTRNRSGQATDATNFRSDVNADGFVNSGDTTVVRARSGTFLP